MKHTSSATLGAALVLSFALVADAPAQTIMLGGGGTVPTRDYATFPPPDVDDGAKAGWMTFAGVLVPVGEAGLSVGGQGFLGRNTHEWAGDRTDLYGGMGLVGFTFGDAEAAAPFVYGGLGVLVHSYKSEEFPTAEGSWSGLAAGGGAGLAFPFGQMRGMVALGYNQGFGDVGDTSWVGISAAMQIPVSRN